MAEVIHDYGLVRSTDGTVYHVRACGSEMDVSRWQGWLEFKPITGGQPLRSPRETTQPNRTDLAYWCGDPGHERGRRAGLNNTAGLERVRDLGHRNGGDGDWHRVRRRLWYRLRTAGAGRQGQARNEGDARKH